MGDSDGVGCMLRVGECVGVAERVGDSDGVGRMLRVGECDGVGVLEGDAEWNGVCPN